MAENETQTETTPLTAESIASIIDSRINTFVHSSKTDLAKLKEQVGGLSTAFEGLKTKETPATVETTTTATPGVTADPKISVLERQVKDLQASNEAAILKVKKADSDTALGKALSGYTFANDASRDVAFKVFSSEMKDLGDGAYAIGDQPLGDAVKTRMADLTGLIAPKNVSGTGATTGRAATLDTNEVRRGMSKDEMQTLGSSLAKLI
jgi:hypothetical protein